jgi:hypothetical protein
MHYFTLKKLLLNNLITLNENLTLEIKKPRFPGAFIISVLTFIEAKSLAAPAILDQKALLHLHLLQYRSDQSR